MAGVSARNIGKSFGATRVLAGVSLDVAEGEFVSLVGPSGCGKTTLMRIIAGLEPASSGAVVIDGVDVTGVRAADRDVAMVFQNYALYPHLTVAQNLAVPLVMRRLDAFERLPFVGRHLGQAPAKYRAIAEETTRVAAMLGIEGLMARKPAQLSGGQRQRVALGRAIVRHPRVFLMDEPLSNLDAAMRVQTRTEIVALHRRVGASTIYVTHDQSEAMTMSDRVAVMMGGAILQIDTPEAIYEDPVDLAVARFIGSPRINTLAAAVGEDGTVRVGDHETAVASPARGPVTLAARPEALALDPDGIPCVIEQVEFLGDSLLVHAAPRAGGEMLIARMAVAAKAGLGVGRPIGLTPDPDKAMLFGPDGRRRPAARLRLEPTRRVAHG